ncbi:hypothetical protein M3Y97_00106200 [Aphelenchoides bicaudatus]|nr:hypothetical protein M3Y97_00106200 [Aphelenchoides bicaudatus]
MTKLNNTADRKSASNDKASCNSNTNQNEQIYSQKPKSTNENKHPKRPSRQSIHRHLDLIQRKRRKHMNLLKKVLVQEEFENSFVKLNNSADLSDSDNEDFIDELFYRRKFGRRQRTANMMRIYARISS